MLLGVMARVVQPGPRMALTMPSLETCKIVDSRMTMRYFHGTAH